MSKPNERRDNIELRLNDDGSVDEILVYDPSTGKVLFHLEQMSKDTFWMRADGKEWSLIAHVFAKIRRTGKPVVRSNYEWEKQ